MRRSIFLSIITLIGFSCSNANRDTGDTQQEKEVGEVWSKEKAKAWEEEVGWLIGCNFSPSTAINQLEMWQEETFDPETIDRELGWAEDLGFNSIRVYLHDLLWEQDSTGFLDRIDEFLEISDSHGIKVMFVLLDRKSV